MSNTIMPIGAIRFFIVLGITWLLFVIFDFTQWDSLGVTKYGGPLIKAMLYFFLVGFMLYYRLTHGVDKLTADEFLLIPICFFEGTSNISHIYSDFKQRAKAVGL